MKIRMMVLVCLSGLAVSSCTSHKEIVNSYKYLITEDKEATTVAENSSPTVVATRLPVSANASALKVVGEAETYLGTPYRYGGINQNGIDCSGLTQKSYLITGIKLPRSASEQSKFGMQVQRNELRPGDLVFFSNDNDGEIDHVGLVTAVNGNDVVFIHSSTSNGVRHDKLNEGYWQPLFQLGRRIGEPE